jgi:glyoxylase-like metal-dependent hydrolase (beta-lactamase superfamily II)
MAALATRLPAALALRVQSAAAPFRFIFCARSGSTGRTSMPLTRRTLMATVAAAAAAPVGLAVSTAAKAAAPLIGKQVATIYRYKLGEFEVTVLGDGMLKAPRPETVVANQPFSEVQKALEEAHLPKDQIVTPFTPFVVNTGKNLVLFDAGFADNGPPGVGLLANGMTAAGIDPKTIDTVIISHFHPDHISGLRNKAGAAVYPNAEIMVPAGEWAFWRDDGEMNKAADVWKPSFQHTRRVFNPIANDVKRFEFGKELVAGISAVDARGHSPGHASFVIASGNAKLLYIADTTNNPALFARNPEWRLWADMDAPTAVASRKRLLDMAVAERLAIAGYHYPFPAVGYIEKRGAGYNFVPAIWQHVL